MSLRWSKLRNLPSCSSGEIWYVCESGSKFVGCCTSNPCLEGCLDENIPHAASPVYQNGGGRTELLRKREQKLAETTTISPSNPTATDTVVAELPSSTAATSTTATLLPSASQAPSSAASHRSRIALIAGTSGGGFLVALLIGVILFFWLHTRKSRKEHQLTFERRISEPGMIQKPLVRHSIAAQTSPSHARSERTASHARSLSRGTFVFPSAPSPTVPLRKTSNLSSSPDNSWPLQTPPYSHSRLNSTTMLGDLASDPYTYRHFSAENFRLPDSPASPFNAWKTSHQPDMPPVRPGDLFRKSIGTFELDSPILPEAFSAATSRKGSLASMPPRSRNGSLAQLSTMSRKSSLWNEESATPDVPAVSPAALVRAVGLGTWDTHRRASSSGLL